MVFDLLKNNGGCRLPCLWGLTPGQTSDELLNDFVAQFGNIESSNDYTHVSNFDNGGVVNITHRENSIQINASLAYYTDEEGSLSFLTLVEYAQFEQEFIDWLNMNVSFIYGDPSFNSALAYYFLPQMLTNYGPPFQVMLAPFPDDPQRPDIKWKPFSLVLIYPDKGIFVEYEMKRESNGVEYYGCPDKSHFRLSTWSPNGEIYIISIIQLAGMHMNELTIDYYKTLEEATSLSRDEFYQIFGDPHNTQCIKTPISIWTE